MAQYGGYGGGRSNGYDQRDGQGQGQGQGGGGGYGAPPARGPPQSSFGQGPRPPAGGAPRYQQGPAMGRDDYGNVEMASLAENAGSFGRAGGGGGFDPNAILNECRAIDGGVDQVEKNLQQLRMLQDRSLNEADQSSGSATSRQLDALSSATMTVYRDLTERVRQIKSKPEAAQPMNAAQVNRIDRRLKQAITSYQQVESQFRKKTQEQMARQYRIVRPDAPESEVRAAVEDPSGGQVFQQAMMQSSRQGQARAVLNAVADRHRDLQKIEQQMIELAQLFQDMDTLVVQQDVVIAQTEQKTEEVVENLDKGNEEMAVAVQTAIKTRKKKWWCLGICVTIIVAIAVIAVVYMFVTGKFTGNKENSSSSSSTGTATQPPPPTTSGSAVSSTGRSKRVNVGGRDVADDLNMNNVHARTVNLHKRIVVPGQAFEETASMPGATKARDTTAGAPVPLSGHFSLPKVQSNVAAPEQAADAAVSLKKRLVIPGQDWQESNSIPGARLRLATDTSPLPMSGRFRLSRLMQTEPVISTEESDGSTESSKTKRFVVPGQGWQGTASSPDVLVRSTGEVAVNPMSGHFSLLKSNQILSNKESDSSTESSIDKRWVVPEKDFETESSTHKKRFVVPGEKFDETNSAPIIQSRTSTGSRQDASGPVNLLRRFALAGRYIANWVDPFAKDDDTQ